MGILGKNLPSFLLTTANSAGKIAKLGRTGKKGTFDIRAFSHHLTKRSL